jgi:hypothetical protein
VINFIFVFYLNPNTKEVKFVIFTKASIITLNEFPYNLLFLFKNKVMSINFTKKKLFQNHLIFIYFFLP